MTRMEQNVVRTIPIACDLCGSRDSEFLFRARDLLHGVPGEFTYVRCKSCGLVYMNPQIAPQEIVRYYPDDYGPHRAKAKPARRSQRAMRISLYKRPFVRQLCQQLSPTARLLDVGCGSGLFLHQVKSICGCEVCGVDDSQHAAQVARSVYGIEESRTSWGVGSRQASSSPVDAVDGDGPPWGSDRCSGLQRAPTGPAGKHDVAGLIEK